MIKLTNSNFDGFISEGVSVVQFSAEWCSPCRALSPIMEEVSNEYDSVKFGKIDVDESSDIASKFGIRSIPTVLIFKDSEIVDKHLGMGQKSSIKSLIDKHL
jgi:thioredoxin 1